MGGMVTRDGLRYVACLSTTVEAEADVTAECEATGWCGQSAWFSVLMLGRLSMPRLRSR